MAASNVISFEQSATDMRRRIADSRMRELVSNCRGQVRDTLPKLMQDLFERLDDDLYELADKSANDALETEYFEAMRAMRKLRRPIEDGFSQGVLDRFDRFWSATPGVDDETDDDGELSLLADETLEEDLAIAGMVSKAENRFHRELFALTLRFGQILDIKDLPEEQNPLAPQVLGDSFRAGLASWDGELRMRLLIYKLFERHVMQYIGGLYDDLNQTLIDHGVLPKIINRIRRNPVAPAIQRAREDSHEPEAGVGLVESDAGQAPVGVPVGPAGDGQAELVGLLTQLVHRQRGGVQAVASASMQRLPAVPNNEVIGALDYLQLVSAAQSPASIDEALTARSGLLPALQQRLDMGDGTEQMRRFGENQQDLIDVVSMMFEFILEDRKLPDSMRALLSRLQIPIIKVALLDRAFFADKAHPARQLLNNLAQAAIGWTEGQERGENSLYGRIESAIDRVLKEFKDDIELFNTINAEFSEFIDREARSAEAAEQRFTQVTEGQEQLALARRRVNDVLFELLRQYPGVHRVARELLMEAWKDVLLLAYLREGEDSSSWRNGMDVAEKLLWSVMPKDENASRQQLLKTIPELLKVLRDSLANISYDQHKANRLFKELQACHIAALRGTPMPGQDEAADDAEAFDPPVELDQAAEIEIVEPVPEEAQDQYDQLASGMAVGQWLEWPGEDDDRIRGKLCWKSQVTGIYVFVNRRGEKLADLNVLEIAQMLREEQALLIEKTGEPLVDRVIDAMVDTLRDDSKAAAPA